MLCVTIALLEASLSNCAALVHAQEQVNQFEFGSSMVHQLPLITSIPISEKIVLEKGF